MNIIIASHRDIENIHGFMDWFVGEHARSRGQPAALVDIDGMGCAFSRVLTEGERSEITRYLRAHADAHKQHTLIGSFSVPLSEISGVCIDEVRTAAREIEHEHHPTMGCLRAMVVLGFGARRDAAEKKRKQLGPRIFGVEVLEKDRQCLLVGQLLIPLDQRLGSVAEIQQYLEAARKEIGDVELDSPPMFVAELDMNFYDQAAAAESCRARLRAAGLAAEVVGLVGKSALWKVIRWQEHWMARTGRVEELMRPGVLSQAGFLGAEDRLDEVLKEDARTLATLGITAADVADRIRKIVDVAIRQSRNGRDDGSYTIGKFRVRLEQWGGFQECPWLCEDEPAWASIDFVIENRKTGAKLSGPGLIVHLIAKHDFFEGPGCPYRVDPRQAAAVLELPLGWWDRLWRR
jgi:hypothetical protein